MYVSPDVVASYVPGAPEHGGTHVCESGQWQSALGQLLARLPGPTEVSVWLGQVLAVPLVLSDRALLDYESMSRADVLLASQVFGTDDCTVVRAPGVAAFGAAMQTRTLRHLRLLVKEHGHHLQSVQPGWAQAWNTVNGGEPTALVLQEDSSVILLEGMKTAFSVLQARAEGQAEAMSIRKRFLLSTTSSPRELSANAQQFRANGQLWEEQT